MFRFDHHLSIKQQQQPSHSIPIVNLDNDSIHPSYSVPYFQEGYVHYVVDAVFALVLSIQHLIEETCAHVSNRKGLCPEFFPFNGTRLLTLLRNISFHNGNIAERK